MINRLLDKSILAILSAALILCFAGSYGRFSLAPDIGTKEVVSILVILIIGMAEEAVRSQIAGILLAAGCEKAEIESILSSIQKGDRKSTEKLIAACRKKQLDRLHDSQK